MPSADAERSAPGEPRRQRRDVGLRRSRRARRTASPTPFDGVVRLSVEPGAVVERRRATARRAATSSSRAARRRAQPSSRRSTAPRASGSRISATSPVPLSAKRRMRQRQGRRRGRARRLTRPIPAAPSPTTTTRRAARFAAGVSQPVALRAAHASPTSRATARRRRIPSRASRSTRPDRPQQLVVTRVASDGFYVTDSRRAGQRATTTSSPSTSRRRRACASATA